MDRGIALAVAEEQALLCSGCGKPRDETMADERVGPVHDYKAEAWRCRACHAKEIAAATFAGRDDINPTAGVYFAVNNSNGS